MSNMKEVGLKLNDIMDEMQKTMMPMIADSFADFADDEETLKAVAISMKSMKVGKEMIAVSCDWYDEIEERIISMQHGMELQEMKLNSILRKLDGISCKLDDLKDIKKDPFGSAMEKDTTIE